MKLTIAGNILMILFLLHAFTCTGLSDKKEIKNWVENKPPLNIPGSTAAPIAIESRLTTDDCRLLTVVDC